MELISNLKTLLSKSQILSVLFFEINIHYFYDIYINLYYKKIGLDLYGLFEVTNRVIAIGMLFCAFGFYDYVIRELSVLVQKKNTNKIPETIFFSFNFSSFIICNFSYYSFSF